MAATRSAPASFLHGHSVAVQLRAGGPVEAVHFIALPGHAIDFECTCGASSVGAPRCEHASAAGERLVREGLARRTEGHQRTRRYVAQ